MFARHGACTGAAICDDNFIVAPLAEGLALAAEHKQVLKQDLDLDLDVPKFNWGGFGVTPNAGSAISAFYAASVSLVQWLG